VFLVSWDELAFSLLLQVTNRPLPPLLYFLAAFGHPGLSSAVAVLMIVPALAIVFVLEPAFRSGVLAGSGR
jgi:ABC-type glycerol-3-phosphate transport system permease component